MIALVAGSISMAVSAWITSFLVIRKQMKETRMWKRRAIEAEAELVTLRREASAADLH